MNSIETHTHTTLPHQHVSPSHKIDELIAYENGVLLNNRYLKIDNIQDGSYGKVSVALDTYTNEKVAIKSMYKKNKGVSAVARHEISILKRIGQENENICHLLNHFQTDDYYFLIFEYCSNGDLYDYLKTINNHLNPNFKNGSLLFFKQFIKELANAMNFAHSKGVYHRDIKPENILIDSKGCIKLTDWGLATICSKCYEPCIGTEKYMAPETFFKKQKNPTHLISYDSIKSDYWSFGITILYTLFGLCPFKIANISDPSFKKFLQDPEVLFKIYPNLTQHGFEVVLTLLQINPQNRSIDNCLDLINNYFNVALTYDQEIEEPIYEIDDSFIFGMDEHADSTTLDHSLGLSFPSSHDTLSTASYQDFTSSSSSSLQATPPSLTSSFAHNQNFSWADEIEHLDDHFNVQQVSSSLNIPTKPIPQSMIQKDQFVGMIRNTPIRYDDLNWY